MKISTGPWIEERELPPFAKFDPLLKVFSLLIIEITILIAPSIYILFFLSIAFVILFQLSWLFLTDIKDSIKGLWFFLALAVLLHLIFPPEGDRLLGLKRGIFFAFKLFLFFVFPSLFIKTTKFSDLLPSIENFFYPLRKFIGEFADEISLTLSLSACFFVSLRNEAKEINKIQLARGIKMRSKGLITRIRSLPPFIIPLFAQAIRQARQTAIALQARGYEFGAKRTHLIQTHSSLRDWLLLFSALLFLAFSIYLISQ